MSWMFFGDKLVVHVPLGGTTRRIAALKVLAAIKRELGR